MRHGTMWTAVILAAGLLAPAAAAANDEGREAWLGVQLSTVPAALAAHLELGGGGLMVRNLFRDSPADKAGLDRYDVIVEADGQKVSLEVKAFADHVRGRKPGDGLALTLYVKGKKKDLTVTLSERPDEWEKMELKYEDEDDVSYHRSLGLRGKILRRGPDGKEWILEDLGDIPALRDLPHWLDPYLESLTETPTADEGRRVDKEGMVLHVQRQKDGTIVVKRYKAADGEEKAEVKTYENMDDLRERDREAYDLLRSSGGRLRLPRSFTQRLPDVRSFKLPERVTPPAPKWEEWSQRFFQGPLEDLRGEVRRYSRDQAEVKPSPRFEVGVDGQITVHVREGDAELSVTYKSKEDFKRQAPELYKQFEAVEKKIE